MAAITSHKQDSKRWAQPTLVESPRVDFGLSYGPITNGPIRDMSGGKLKINVQGDERTYTLSLDAREALRLREYLNSDTAKDNLQPIGYDASGAPTANPNKVYIPKSNDPDCPDAILPDGAVCPKCGGKRAPSGVGGGSWVHVR